MSQRKVNKYVKRMTRRIEINTICVQYFYYQAPSLTANCMCFAQEPRAPQIETKIPNSILTRTFSKLFCHFVSKKFITKKRILRMHRNKNSGLKQMHLVENQNQKCFLEISYFKIERLFCKFRDVNGHIIVGKRCNKLKSYQWLIKQVYFMVCAAHAQNTRKRLSDGDRNGSFEKIDTDKCNTNL